MGKAKETIQDRIDDLNTRKSAIKEEIESRTEEVQKLVDEIFGLKSEEADIIDEQRALQKAVVMIESGESNA